MSVFRRFVVTAVRSHVWQFTTAAKRMPHLVENFLEEKSGQKKRFKEFRASALIKA